MKKLLITLMIVSPFSFADWGDVYYCQMTSFVLIDSDGTVKNNYQLQKFKFKLDSTEEAMVFGKGGYFDDVKIPINPKNKGVNIGIWRTNSDFSMLGFMKGKLVYSFVTHGSITSLSADCDKF